MMDSIGAGNATTPEFCLWGMRWFWACMNKAEWSGWVQAIGSILALLATGGATAFQVKAARNERERNARDRADALLDSLEGIARALLVELESNNAALAASPSGWCDGSAKAFGEVYDAARAIPIHDLPRRELVKIAFEVRHAAALAVATRDKHIQGHRSSRPYTIGSNPFFNEMDAAKLVLRHCYDERRGVSPGKKKAVSSKTGRDCTAKRTDS